MKYNTIDGMKQEKMNLSHITTSIISPATIPLHEIKIDPDKQLTEQWRDKFSRLHQKFSETFRAIIGHYNDKSGKICACVNIGKNTPPTRKLKIPKYSNSNL